MKLIVSILTLLITQHAHAAVYNCNGTFTDVPCGNAPVMRLSTPSGFSSTQTNKQSENSEPANENKTQRGEKSTGGSVSSPEPAFCKELRADLEDARWRKDNMHHQENIRKAKEDEKRLVDEIWFKCSKRFE